MRGLRSPIGAWLLTGFGTLMVLIAFLAFSQVRRAEEIHRELIAANDAYTRRDQILSDLRADLYNSGIYIRDYLVERNPEAAAELGVQLIRVKKKMMDALTAMNQIATPAEADTIRELSKETIIYWSAFDPVFGWSAEEKQALATWFLRTKVVPRRGTIRDLAQTVREINLQTLKRERVKLDASQESFLAFLRRMGWIVLVVASAVAGASIYWIVQLGRQEEAQRRRAEQAEGELRRLSQQLALEMEEERKALSRELHDQVGQCLTALRVELGNLRRIGPGERDKFDRHVQEAKDLAEQTLRTVRDLAMGLRPSMLDDLGVGPAVEWQAREFSRRSGVPVEVRLHGALKELPDTHRTCLFRIVQEALTNVTRHANAKAVRIELMAGPEEVSLEIADDGRGMPVSANGGLGLLGIQERVRELKGRYDLRSSPGAGTVLRIWLPVVAQASACMSAARSGE